MRSRPQLDAADVRLLMAAARAEAERLRRDDRDRRRGRRAARLYTPEAAVLKARTAAIVRSPTQDLQAAVRADPALLAFPGRLPLTGGLPLRYGATVMGGVGSSGGELEDDTKVCRAVADALAGLASGA